MKADSHNNAGTQFQTPRADARVSVGQVSEAERDVIQALHERKNGLQELVRSLVSATKEELAESALYERLVTDMGATSTLFSRWWSDVSRKYKWQNVSGGRWEIDFESCEIFLVKPVLP